MGQRRKGEREGCVYTGKGVQQGNKGEKEIRASTLPPAFCGV